jgi:hypothetical protein
VTIDEALEQRDNYLCQDMSSVLITRNVATTELGNILDEPRQELSGTATIAGRRVFNPTVEQLLARQLATYYRHGI